MYLKETSLSINKIMNIHFNTEQQQVHHKYDIVERKGMGHPDTLADMIAEDFSNHYSQYCLKNFGGILNHWADKVVLSGGTAELDYGFSKILKPISVYLFGKAVTSFGDKDIPIDKIFTNSCGRVFTRIFNKEILNTITYHVDINNVVGKEHKQQFYAPSSKKDILTVESFKSNDTIICSGYAPYSASECLAIDIENYINSVKFKKRFNFTGFDVKVMIVRIDNFFDITICVPFIANRTSSFNFYNSKKEDILKEIKKFILNIKYFNKQFDFSLSLNTKDFADHAYLVAFGSALDKGDFGAVGRGNKYSGVISLNRKTNIEAVAGKNPQNHSGKLFTIFAHHLAWKIYNVFHRETSIDITAKNGEDLNNPSHVIINFSDGLPLINKHKVLVEKMVFKDVKKIKNYANIIMKKDVIKEHIKRNFIYE